MPHLFEDGLYGAADPANGKQRHHIGKRVPVADIEGLRECLRMGWPIWMSIRGTRDRRLVSKGVVDAEAPDGPAVVVPAPRRAAVPAARVEAAVSLPESALPVGRDASGFLAEIARMTEREAIEEIAHPRRLLMASHSQGGKRLEVVYAPFDHVNAGAEVVIVGITPGRQQMREAILEARKALAEGATDNEALARAKVHASFAGPRRHNLVKIMDAVGVNGFLGVSTTASLWREDSARAHFMSALRYPTFADGEDYNRSPDLNRTPFLFGLARKWLAQELSRCPDAVIVPMGDMVTEAVVRVCREIGVPRDRILAGVPHASGANNGPISRFLGAKGESDPWRRRFHEVEAQVARLRAASPKP